VLVDGVEGRVNVSPVSTGSLLCVEGRAKRGEQLGGFTLCAGFVQLVLPLFDALLGLIDGLLSDLLCLV